ncbi:DUF6685 family protein [Gallibacterium anatis]|uniref:Uncharacterized protein n=1 Tax=Gallibacterium anatis 12656/12 TaxID=1195244 RepID=U1H2I0_9PAST|nr:DUF6685 family protein [Gallibacterium anatis]ERF78983.1 hypothetical protein N561_03295 [Gallibacterium anatis 12656/12]KGQ49523.1 hypothetical protein JL04_05320 [Gallibacterium anatis]
MDSNFKDKLFLLTGSLETIFRSFTPSSIVRFNLKFRLKKGIITLKPKLRDQSYFLGSKRYFWQYFRNEFVEWYHDKTYGLSSRRNIELPHLLSHLTVNQIIPNWQFEIQIINNVGCSKSLLSQLSSLDELVEQDSRDLIPEITETMLHKNMQHRESKIFHTDNSTISCELWSGSFTWENCGGSHHFAAARYIAKKLEQDINLTGILHLVMLNKELFRTLFSKYHLFLITLDTDENLLLNKTLENLKIPFMNTKIEDSFSINSDENNLRLLAFRNDSLESELVADIFRQSKAINLYGYFYLFLLKQEDNRERYRKILMV